MTNQQGAPEALTDFERRHAIRQGHEIAASDGYFEARPQIDSNDRRKVFQAGFERGWDHHAALVEAQQPAPTPRADSQPAPTGEPWHGHQFKEVRHGYWQCDCGKAIKEAEPTPIADKDSYPPLPSRYTYDDDGEELFSADQMRAYVDADRAMRAAQPAGAQQPGAAYAADAWAEGFRAGVSWRMAVEDFWEKHDYGEPPKEPSNPYRASRGQAPAGAASVTDAMVLAALQVQYPAGYDTQLRHPANGPKTSARTEAEIDLARRMIAAALATHSAPAAQAPSVLEDAARYRWLAAHCRSTSEHWGGRWSIVVDGPAPELENGEYLIDEAIDAAMAAARKQGANHD